MKHIAIHFATISRWSWIDRSISSFLKVTLHPLWRHNHPLNPATISMQSNVIYRIYDLRLVRTFALLHSTRNSPRWIVHQHKGSASKERLSNGIIKSYVGCILTIGRNYLFKGDPFFIGLDGESKNWYTSMRSKIERIIYLQCIDNEENGYCNFSGY